MSITFPNLPAETVTAYLLYRIDPDTQLLQPIRQISADTQVTQESFVDLGIIPTTATTGQYLLIGCAQENCSVDHVNSQLPQLDTNPIGLDYVVFEIPARIDNFELHVENDAGIGETTRVDAAWRDPLASPDDDVRMVWYKDDEPLVLQQTTAASESLPLLNFLDADRQGASLYEPTLANQVLPGIPQHFPQVDYPSLDHGTYKVELYLNGVLEASQTIVVDE